MSTKKICFLVFTFIQFSAVCQINYECVDMQPICTNPGTTFTATASGGDAMILNPANNYDCLNTTPNPTWFYLDIATSGNIYMNLSASSDIDFIIYGPFASLPSAIAQCSNMGNGGPGANVIDCSYSATNSEYPNIPTAFVGEIYVMLITNYADVVQDLTLVQVAGTGATDCSIITPNPCLSNPGTYTVEKNNTLTASPIYLCPGDAFEINSNNDYALPTDTIPQPTGDGIYSAQLMWLVYDAAPTNADPAFDPGFLNAIIAEEDISDINNATSPIIDDFGCGTYWFVPVTGDDGVGGNNNVANGATDNGGLHWDKNNNDCFVLGTPVEVTYACAIQTNVSVHCNPPSTVNGMDIQITGGVGFYTVMNLQQGDLTSTAIANGGTAHINNLENNDVWEIEIVDQQGCMASVNGVFQAPIISSVNLTPAITCPLGGNGTVDVVVNGTSGNGAPYSIVMATDLPTPGTLDSYSNVAGTVVGIIISDQEGCTTDSIVTITSSGHFIDAQVVSLQNELCFGDGDGAATISAIPTPSGTVTNVTWTGPSGQHPGGNPGGPVNTTQSGLEAGTWFVTIIDNTGCEVTIPVTIESPQSLELYAINIVEPTCTYFSDGSFQLQSTGGEFPFVYSPSNPINNITAGTYVAYVTDSNGCLDSVQIILEDPDSLYAEFTIKNILCYGDSTGGIIINNVYNNLGPISYYWNMAGIVPNPPSTSNVVNGLPIGTYVLTIQDNFCSNLYEFTLTQNTELLFSAFGSNPVIVANDGTVYCEATGGVPGYSYVWTNLNDMISYNDSVWNNITGGDYMIEAVDAAGCSLIDTISVGWLNTPEINFSDLIKVYPTLISNGQLYIDNSGFEINTIFTVFDLSGKKVHEENLAIGHNLVSVKLSDGPYFYVIKGENDQLDFLLTGKIVVISN